MSSESTSSTTRGVEYAQIIDVIAHDGKTDEVLLIMIEPRPWDGTELRLFQLQEKINAYLSFMLDGEMAEAYPQFAGKKVRLQLECVGVPGSDVVDFLGKVREQIGFQGIDLEVRVMGDEKLLSSNTQISSVNIKSASDSHDVFFAHHNQDKSAVLAIAEALRKRNLRPWVDVDEIPPGRWFQDFLQAAIPKVKSAAIFLGPNGIGKWQAVELRAFISQCVERNIPVIPVLLPGVKEIPSNLIFLRELNAVKFQSSVTEQSSLDRLEWGITGKRPGTSGGVIFTTATTGAEPKSEAARELLKLILEHPVREERGLFEISEKIIPLCTNFIPNLTCGGAAPSMKTRIFQAAVEELIRCGWLLSPELVPSHGGVAYELNPDLNPGSASNAVAP